MGDSSRNEVTVSSSSSAEAVLVRLTQGLELSSAPGRRGIPRVAGRVTDNRVLLWADGPAITRLGPVYGPRHIVFEGVVVASGSGAEVRGHFRARVWTFAPTAFGVVIVVLLAIALLETVVREGPISPLIMLTIGTAVFGIAIAVGLRLQQVIGRHDRARIERFLRSSTHEGRVDR